MKRSTTVKVGIFLLTIASWFSIVFLYGYHYIWSRVAHPPALDRFPVDLEAVAIDRSPVVQLIGFAIMRLPFLFAALIAILMFELKVFSRPGDQGDMNGDAV